MDKKTMIGKMSEFISIREKGLIERRINVQNMSFVNLRDAIIGVGKILEEDFTTNTYIVNIPAGAANMNHAVLAIQLSGNCLSILGYAKEGILNQHTAERALEKVIERISTYAV